MIATFAIILTILLGLCIGSFLNVVVYRIPRKMSLAKPSSHCPKCNYKLKWFDNIPILSYIILKGRCRNCKQKISPRYPLVEFANMALYLVALMVDTNLIFANSQNNYLLFVLHCLAFSILICVFFCDLDNLEIPDELQMALLCLGIISFLSQDISSNSRVFGFVVGGGFFATFAILFYLIKGKEGLGFGDIKLMAVAGLFLGLKSTILAIILSSFVGAVVLSILLIKNKGEKDKEFPFATFIAPSVMVCMLAGNYVVDWYLSLFVV